MEDLFRFIICRFRMVCQERAVLPNNEHIGALLRDRFGSALKYATCPLASQACRTGCTMPTHCIYSRFFETSSQGVEAGTLQGKDLYRPFVLEPPFSTQRVFEVGEALVFHLTLIGNAIEAFPYFVLAFEEMGSHGFGIGRTRWKLTCVESVPTKNASTGESIFDGDRRSFGEGVVKTFAEVAIESQQLSPNKLRLVLRTPLRLEQQGNPVAQVTPDLLCRTLMRRLSRLASIWCDTTLDVDFAEQIRTWSEGFRIEGQGLRMEGWNRHSMRQGKSMKLSGLRGTLLLEGELGDLRPYLKMGEYLHLGKQTAFGLGCYECHSVE